MIIINFVHIYSNDGYQRIAEDHIKLMFDLTYIIRICRNLTDLTGNGMLYWNSEI